MYSPVLFEMLSDQIVAERLANAERQRRANALDSTSSVSGLKLVLSRTLRMLASRVGNSTAYRPRLQHGGDLH
jgi:hypothetical protein